MSDTVAIRYARDIKIAPTDPHMIGVAMGRAALSQTGILCRTPDLMKTWECFGWEIEAHSTEMSVDINRGGLAPNLEHLNCLLRNPVMRQ